MNLIIDIQMIGKDSGGALTYIQNMLSYLFKNKQKGIRIFLIGDETNITVLNLEKNIEFDVIKPKINTKSPLRRLVYNYYLIKWLDYKFNKDDVLWMPFNTGLNIKTKKIRSILTVHDFLVFDYPKCVPFLNRIFRRFSLSKSIKNANMVITVSDFTRQQLYLHFNKFINNKEVRTIYEGVNDKQWNCPEQLIFSRGNYLFFLGVGRKNKNLEFLLESFYILKTKYKYGGELYIGGEIKENYKKELLSIIVRLKLEDNIRFLGYLSTNRIKKLYKECDVFVFPSFYEGFGLPILEANSCGAKVCCSNSSSLKEVGDTFAIFFNPFNKFECAKSTNYALNNRYYSCSNPNFCWEKASRQFLKFISLEV